MSILDPVRISQSGQTRKGCYIRLFLATGMAMIDVQKGELKLRVQDDEVKFSIFNAMRHPTENDACFMIEAVEAIVPR